MKGTGACMYEEKARGCRYIARRREVVRAQCLPHTGEESRAGGMEDDLLQEEEEEGKEGGTVGVQNRHTTSGTREFRASHALLVSFPSLSPFQCVHPVEVSSLDTVLHITVLLYPPPRPLLVIDEEIFSVTSEVSDTQLGSLSCAYTTPNFN